jgi:hypothetical protein
VRDERFTAADVKRLKDNHSSSAETLVKTRALTGKDILAKIGVVLEHSDAGFGWTSIGKDLTAVDRPEPGPAVCSAFDAWRAAWVAMGEYDASDGYTDAEASRLSDIVYSTMLSVFRAPCTTAGDFLVKSYAHLLWHATHTNTREIRGTGTGSFFDINHGGIDSDSLVTDEYYRSVYDDLNHSDLGCCLLATGLIAFDARKWLERAESIGMAVSVIARACGERSLAISMVDSDDPRLQREQRRLQRILAFDHHLRWLAVSDLISKERPDLVCHVQAHARAGAA